MIERRESQLLGLAGIFLALYAAALTLAPAARENKWTVAHPWSQWLGLFLAAGAIFAAHRWVSRSLPNRDPYFLPVAALLSGWGLMTVWRLDASLGIRQAFWLIGAAGALVLIARWGDSLYFLRRYKYVLLAAGLALTALTLILGTNPIGAGPRLWLGCCGIYLQPSEPLKLLLVVYLAAYLADKTPMRAQFFPMLLPTALATGLALLLLVVQRDLGTASIFILLYAAQLYLATDKRRVLLAATAALLTAGLIGYFYIDVVHARLEAWLDPWNDPGGKSYQIIQSLLAVANGGVFGRGPGLGSPGLVPVAHSDFIFSAIAEESGLAGTIGLLAAYGIFLARGLRAAMRASDKFQRLLAGGFTAYVGIQALVIIGGDLRLLPLTGVTLPFVSYGGSSLLTAFVGTALLLVISDRRGEKSARLQSAGALRVAMGLLGVGLVAAALAQGGWAVIRAPQLLRRTDNPRRSIADRYVRRGSLLDRNNMSINATMGSSGSFVREYLYPDLVPITGYTHPIYGQAGLESSLDDYLRGLQGNPASLVAWNQLLYGAPPPGLDVRLSLDLELQRQADDGLGPLPGAAVLLDARSGEVLVMASHPTFNPNELDTNGAALAQDVNAPLLDRAAQGEYPLGAAATPFERAAREQGAPATPPAALYSRLGFYTAPELRMPVASPGSADASGELRISPLQLALAAAALSDHGLRPPPRIALAVDTPQEGWVVLPALSETTMALSAPAADQAALALAGQGLPFWEWLSVVNSGKGFVTWYSAGTLPDWQGTPLAVAVLIEGARAHEARKIGQQLLGKAIKP